MRLKFDLEGAMGQNFSAEEQWRMLMEEGKATVGRRRLAYFYSLLPSSSRCRLCNLPFAGLMGQLMHQLGKHPSTFNPHLCSACDRFARANPGGVEIRLSMLFADIRGSTSLAEGMNPADFARLIDRFFATATDILSRTDAIIDKLAGDQVSGYYVPGLVGPNHARVAVLAAQALLRSTGYQDPQGPWIPVGIGVHTGQAFIGAVGTQGGITDITALGDAVNVAARLGSNARPGEILVSQDAYAEAGLEINGAEKQELVVKGRSKPVSVYVL
jgi:adenylate cyclase